MAKATYFIAAIYQRLVEKNPDNPYLNIRVIITMNVIFHISQLIVWLKNGVYENAFSNSDTLLFWFLLIIGCIVFYIAGILFPKDDLNEMEIKEKYKFICYRISVCYFVLNFSFLMFLLFHYLPVAN